MPLPLRIHPPPILTGDGTRARLSWPALLERPLTQAEPQSQAEHCARRLMQRAQAVWDRLREVDLALADPAAFWSQLRALWAGDQGTREPSMDIIVRQADQLAATLDLLERTHRHALRRTHRLLPVSRVQELDRRAMTWLVRQPGESLAERAGDRQHILAVAREEHFDLLENRVLRAYAELAHHVARDYTARHHHRAASRRTRQVAEFGRRCRRLALDLCSRGVRLADASATPNFVLQHNPGYRDIWTGWRDLLKRERARDEVWTWQARSWEEFCALALAVAISGVPGCDLVAASPISFLKEQDTGSWIVHDNPLAVFHSAATGQVVELEFRSDRRDAARAHYGAPVWLTLTPLKQGSGYARRIPVWPLWDMQGGLVPGEARELDGVVARGTQARITGAMVIRPVGIDGLCAHETHRTILTLTLGAQDEGLRGGLEILTRFAATLLNGTEAP